MLHRNSPKYRMDTGGIGLFGSPRSDGGTPSSSMSRPSKLLSSSPLSLRTESTQFFGDRRLSKENERDDSRLLSSPLYSPLSSSSRFNTNHEDIVRADAMSAGYVSRIAEAVNGLKVGEFPSIHLRRAPSTSLEVTSYGSPDFDDRPAIISPRALLRAARSTKVKVQIASPLTSTLGLLEKPPDNDPAETSLNNSTKAVLQVLKEISKKRIHMPVEDETEVSVPKRSRLTQHNLCLSQLETTLQQPHHPSQHIIMNGSGKRVREEVIMSNGGCNGDGDTTGVLMDSAKRARTNKSYSSTINNEILSSLSSSVNITPPHLLKKRRSRGSVCTTPVSYSEKSKKKHSRASISTTHHEEDQNNTEEGLNPTRKVDGAKVGEDANCGDGAGSVSSPLASSAKEGRIVVLKPILKAVDRSRKYSIAPTIINALMTTKPPTTISSSPPLEKNDEHPPQPKTTEIVEKVVTRPMVNALLKSAITKFVAAGDASLIPVAGPDTRTTPTSDSSTTPSVTSAAPSPGLSSTAPVVVTLVTVAPSPPPVTVLSQSQPAQTPVVSFGSSLQQEPSSGSSKSPAPAPSLVFGSAPEKPAPIVKPAEAHPPSTTDAGFKFSSVETPQAPGVEKPGETVTLPQSKAESRPPVFSFGSSNAAKLPEKETEQPKTTGGFAFGLTAASPSPSGTGQTSQKSMFMTGVPPSSSAPVLPPYTSTTASSPASNLFVTPASTVTAPTTSASAPPITSLPSKTESPKTPVFGFKPGGESTWTPPAPFGGGFSTAATRVAPFSVASPPTNAVAPTKTDAPKIFGATTTPAGSPFGDSGSRPVTSSSVFGAPSASGPKTTPSVTAVTSSPAVPTFGAGGIFGTTFGQKKDESSSSAVKTGTATVFGSTPSFGASTATPTTTATASPLFGTQPSSNSATPLFGAASAATNSGTPAPPFGPSSTTANTSTSLFGATATTTNTATPLFGASATTTNTATPLFGASATTTNTATPLFGASTTTTNTVTPLFGASVTTTNTTTPLFGASAATTITATPLFGASATTTNTATPLFGASAATTNTTTPLFGASSSTNTTTPLFGAPSGATASTAAGGSTDRKPGGFSYDLGSSSSTPAFSFRGAQTQQQQQRAPGVFAFGSGSGPSNSNNTQNNNEGGVFAASKAPLFGGGSSAGSGPSPAFGSTTFGSTATAAPAFGSSGFGGARSSTGTGTSGAVFGSSATQEPAKSPPFVFSGAAASGGFSASKPFSFGTASSLPAPSGSAPLAGTPAPAAPSAVFTFGQPSSQQQPGSAFQFNATPAPAPATGFSFNAPPPTFQMGGNPGQQMFCIGSGNTAPRVRSIRTRRRP